MFRERLHRLIVYTPFEGTSTAGRLGYQTICANDHLVFSRPWLDGPTALALTLGRAEQMTLLTTVSLPVVRGPVQLAKTMAAIDLLSGGRLIVGVGPGSSARDYEITGIPFEERWKRLDEAVPALRALWRTGSPPLQRDVLLYREACAGAVPGPGIRAADLDRKLGLPGGTPPRGPSRRWLVGLRLQYDASRIWRCLDATPRCDSRMWQRARWVSQRYRDDVHVHYRGLRQSHTENSRGH